MVSCIAFPFSLFKAVLGEGVQTVGLETSWLRPRFGVSAGFGLFLFYLFSIRIWSLIRWFAFNVLMFLIHRYLRVKFLGLASHQWLLISRFLDIVLSYREPISLHVFDNNIHLNFCRRWQVSLLKIGWIFGVSLQLYPVCWYLRTILG